MKEQTKNKLKELKEYIKKIEYLGNAAAIISWDSMVNMPRKAVEHRSEVQAYLSGEFYKLSTSSKVKEFIDYFDNTMDELDEVSKATLRELKDNYNRTKKIPDNEYEEYTKECSISLSAWEEAKHNSDYNIFKPHLKKVIDFNKKFVQYWGYEGNKYNALLNNYEPGITTEKLDKLFGEMRDGIISVLDKIKKSRYVPKIDFFTKKFTKAEQEEFSKFVLKKVEYDYEEAGRIDEYMHPFTTNFGNKDVRITTFYYENDFRSALFSCIHEGGHAIYEQDIPDKLEGTFLNSAPSMGLHESQSRFYENIIGRGKAFWKYFYPEAQKRFPQFDGVSFGEFYDAINYVEPSLIRTEADELTYGLHIIIRYEIERMLINDEITVDELPKVWNQKYKEYLGVEPSKDAEGVLQDMHWSDGSFGYFPSYALGNLYGAQLLAKMEQDMPNMYNEIEKGNLHCVHEWLKENVHKYGAIYKPADLIKKVTGEELTAKYFIDYLDRKFGEIYYK